MLRSITHLFKNTLVLIVALTLVVPSGNVQAATAEELRKMVEELQRKVESINKVSPRPVSPIVTTPVGVFGGSVNRFSSFIQETTEIVVSENASVVSGKLRPIPYDRNLNQVTLYVSPSKGNALKNPWDVLDTLEVHVNGYNVRDVDVRNESAWRRINVAQSADPVYAITVYQGNVKLPAKSAPSFVIDASFRNGADGDLWRVWVPKNGITTWSQQTKHISYGPSQRFQYELVTAVDDEEEIYVDVYDVRANAEGESGNIGDFTIEIEVTAIDSDIYIPNTITENLTSGISYAVLGPVGASVSAAFSSLAEKQNNYYLIREGETERIEANVWVDAKVPGDYKVELTQILYKKSESGALVSFELDNDFSTPYVRLLTSTPTPKPTPTPTTTPVVTPKPTDCMSGGVAYPDGTRRTIITVDGRTTSIMDGFFLCTTGTWQKQGFPPRVPTSGVSTSTKTTAPVSTSTPKVRGASVDVYSQIATTLMAISVLLEDWQ